MLKMTKWTYVGWTAFIGAIVILFFWVGSAVAILKVYPEPAEHGTFGDLFGAVNSLFSGLAFLGVILTVLLQREELKEQRKEIRLARIAHESSAFQMGRQAETSEFINKLEAYNHIIRAISMQEEQIREERHQSADIRRRELKAEKERYLAELRRAIETRISGNNWVKTRIYVSCGEPESLVLGPAGIPA